MMLSFIIPAYNEENQIAEILNKIINLSLINNLQKEIIVIDDGSKDKTVDKVKEIIQKNELVNIKLLYNNKNLGKGAAVRYGIQEASGEYIIIQDADNELDPTEINDLLIPIIKGNADVVYGSRFIGHKPRRVLSLWHRYGNKIVTNFSNILTGLSLTDMTTCYKLFKRDYIKKLYLKENGFAIDPEITAKIRRFPEIRIYEVGISYYARSYSEGKKIKFIKDGIKQICAIIKYNLICRKYLRQ